MDIHKNARLTPKAVCEAVGVCPRTVRKWVERYKREGLAGLQDRSSRPRRLYQPTPQPVIDRIEVLRRQRLTGKAIAVEVGVSPATVSRVLQRLGLNKLSALAPAELVRRYERERPGEMIHNDAVVQGLSELPQSKDVSRWGVLTIGTGLGNARFTNRRQG